jgi:hypothetical protein
MAPELNRVLEFVVIILVAAGAVWLLFRVTRRPPARDNLVLGYPPEHYPAHEATRLPALRKLAATQARLHAVYHRLPSSDPTLQVGEVAIWLRVFLVELRRMMDAAYRVALIADVYRQADHLDRLAAEVAELESQIADDIAQVLLGHQGAVRNEALSRRLGALRECAGELGRMAGAPATPGDD